MNKLYLFVASCLCLVPLGVILPASYVIETRFARDCGNWLKMAADANSVPIAAERLGKAIGYIEDHRLTDGSTGVFWDKPTYALRPWYDNLKAAQANLAHFPAGATEADTNTALVKLRETLLDHGEKGDYVTLPDGIAFYPGNAAWMAAWAVSIPLAILGVVGISFEGVMKLP